MMHKMPISTINIYIAKDFLWRFLQIISVFALLMFFINLLDSLDRIRSSDASFFVAIKMAFLQIPAFLNDIVPSLVLISAIVTFSILSSRSEITIIRMGGFSLWQIVRPVAISAFILGFFWILIVGPISIFMTKSLQNIERKYIDQEVREVLEPKNGIWLKQGDKDQEDQEIIIQARKVYKDKVELRDVKILFFNQKGLFYKKINSKNMVLNDGHWMIENGILNDENNINEKVKNIKIATDLKADFVKQKIVNNFQNVKLFSVFDLPRLIKNLELSGFSSNKFKVYFYGLLSKPFLFVAMILIACYFGLGHIRNQRNSLMIFLGIIFGLTIYVSSTILENLGSSGIIPNFAATWLVIIMCLSSGILMIYNKENI